MVELKARGSTRLGRAVSPDTMEMNSGPACRESARSSGAQLELTTAKAPQVTPAQIPWSLEAASVPANSPGSRQYLLIRHLHGSNATCPPEAVAVFDRVCAQHGDEGVQEQAKHQDDLEYGDPEL